MKTQDVDRNDWESFMDEFSRQHDGWLASIEVGDGGGGRRVLADALPFLGISAEVGVGGRDYINIRVGRTDVQSITHRIASPQRVYFLHTEIGLHEGVQIESRDEGKTIVRFSSPAKPEELNGLPTMGV